MLALCFVHVARKLISAVISLASIGGLFSPKLVITFSDFMSPGVFEKHLLRGVQFVLANRSPNVLG